MSFRLSPRTMKSSETIRSCGTCGQCHPHIPGRYTADCVMVGSRSHKQPRRRKSNEVLAEDRLITILMPTTIREQAILFDHIWFWFVDLKHNNTDIRECVSSLTTAKGALRAVAPLLWLEWKSWDGTRGQTRSQENYEKLWKTFVQSVDESGRNLPVAWLTLRNLGPDAVASFSKYAVAGEQITANNYTAAGPPVRSVSPMAWPCFTPRISAVYKSTTIHSQSFAPMAFSTLV